MSFIKRPFTAKQIARGEQLNLTPEQKLMQKQYDNFKETEYNVDKSFHRVILKDDGIPNIKKTSFKMPGYRQILSDKDEDDYEIDNYKLYDRIYLAHLKNR